MLIVLQINLRHCFLSQLSILYYSIAMAPLHGPVADGVRSSPTQFLIKIYHLVDDHTIDEIISWTADGSTFVVWRPGDFARDLLPQKFKHNNFTSFIRQLNTYGFKKISPDRWEFSHEFFRKDHEHLLSQIERRKVSSTLQTPAAAASSGDEPVKSSDSNGGTAELMEENGRLKRENALLTSQNVRMKSFCDSVRRLVHDYGGGNGSGSSGGDNIAAAAFPDGDSGPEHEAQIGSRQAVESSARVEEELNLQLSLSNSPHKRACPGFSGRLP